MEVVSIILLIVLVLLVIKYSSKKKTNISKEHKEIKKDFPPQWRIILPQKVAFYKALNAEEKELFEYKVQQFLESTRITGIDTTVDDVDRVLVAASAIIPIFAFPNWEYTNLNEVLLYPGRFNEKFETIGKDLSIMGMVGTGYMEGMMILSKPALHHGFNNENDKKNTAIHEFVHLIDKMDGSIDGIPSILLEKQYTLPWIDLMTKEIENINFSDSDINPYGGVNKMEFFSVVSEYFFERPKLLERKHPELYSNLEGIFNQDMSARDLKKKETSIGRNSPCPCNSGKKFKKCCGKEHYSQS